VYIFDKTQLNSEFERMDKIDEKMAKMGM